MRPAIEDRLKRRAKPDENNPDDVVERLLDETTVNVPLETVIREAMDQYENVASVYVQHGMHEDPHKLYIHVFTGEADSFEDPVDVFGPKYRAVVKSNSTDEEFRLPFSVFATFDGPSTRNHTTGTPIYMDENVRGAEPIDVDTGLDYLRDKLGNPAWDRQSRYDDILESTE